MKKIVFLYKILLVYFLINSNLFAEKISFFEEGKKLFEKKNFLESKILFEKSVLTSCSIGKLLFLNRI